MLPATGGLLDFGQPGPFGVIGGCHQYGIQDSSLLRHTFNVPVLPVLSYVVELYNHMWCTFSPDFLADGFFTQTPAETCNPPPSMALRHMQRPAFLHHASGRRLPSFGGRTTLQKREKRMLNTCHNVGRSTNSVCPGDGPNFAACIIPTTVILELQYSNCSTIIAAIASWSSSGWSSGLTRVRWVDYAWENGLKRLWG